MALTHRAPARADADACVHSLYAPGGAAVAPVGDAFPGSLSAEGGIDRAALSAAVVAKGREEALRVLEHIVHPLVTASRDEFVKDAQAVSDDTGQSHPLRGFSPAPLALLRVPKPTGALLGFFCVWQDGEWLVVVDVPLLLETHSDEEELCRQVRRAQAA